MGIQKVIYQFWVGDNPITDNRIAGVRSLAERSGVECRLLRKEDIAKCILPEFPIHRAYPYLNDVKKSDYLRCYFMHHFGGGYADIKHYSSDNNWKECFDVINESDGVDVIGQEEIKGGSPVREYNTPENLKRIVSNSYFIVRPHSKLTTEWWNAVNSKLDEKYEMLKANPAVSPRDRRPEYALRWAELMGELFHPICWRLWGEGRVMNTLRSGREWREYQ